jgi:hypothetical protein
MRNILPNLFVIQQFFLSIRYVSGSIFEHSI